jgi:hypothetical protein
MAFVATAVVCWCWMAAVLERSQQPTVVVSTGVRAALAAEALWWSMKQRLCAGVGWQPCWSGVSSAGLCQVACILLACMLRWQYTPDAACCNSSRVLVSAGSLVGAESAAQVCFCSRACYSSACCAGSGSLMVVYATEVGC